VAFPKVANVLGFLVVIFLERIKYCHVEPLDFMKFLKFFWVILANELDGAMWHLLKWQKL
jgi:hypothetical protein